MHTLKNIVLAVFFILKIASVHAQSKDKIENFTLEDAVSHKNISLNEYAAQKAIVLVFTSNYCPYSKLYEKRINSISNTYESQGVKFLAINSNSSSDNIDDSTEEMAVYAKEKKLPFPYLADKDQKIATALGVTKNPEIIVLQPRENSFFVKYRGAIDNNPQIVEDVTENYLKDAIVSILNKKNLTYTEKRATGCMIKKE